jgi:hypothetical protein
MTALALAFQLLVLGLHVLVPWRLGRADATDDGKRLWALLAMPLLLGAALAAIYTLDEQLDAALAWGLRWPPASLPALLLGLAAAAVALCDLVLFAGFRKLEPLGWRVAAGLAAPLLLAASLAGELLRVGRGPTAGLAGLALAALGRVPLALAAGEAAAGPVRLFSPITGVVLPLSLLGYSAALRSALGSNLLTLGAASLLLLAARFLPPSLRRPAALAGALLAALFLDRTSELSAALEPDSSIPDAFLTEP